MENSLNQPDPIRVLIVDDHSMMRTGLRYTLQSFTDMELVGEAGSGAEAIELCDQVQPDVILMDMAMPGMDGAQTTQLVRQSHPKMQIIVLTSFQERDLVERAIQAGAIGYLLKNATAEELGDAIRSAFAGRPTLAQEATEVLIQSAQNRSALGDDLTDREREVLGLMARGKTNPQIAEELTLSMSTVKFHIRNILSKLGAGNRAEAIHKAWQHQLIEEKESPT